MNYSRGFTLVEVMVALVVLSLLMLGTLSALRTFADTQARIKSVARKTDQVRQVSQFLRNTLRQAVFRSESAADEAFFRIDAQEMIWLAPLSGIEGVAGLKRYRLYLSDSGKLSLQFSDYVKDLPGEYAELSDPYILLEDVEEFSLLYRQSLEEDWVTEEGELFVGLPQAIKINLVSGGYIWPEIIVAPDQYRGGRNENW